MVATRRRGSILPVELSKKPKRISVAKPVAKPQQNRTYGLATFLDKTGKNRKNEARAKVKREEKMVESPFKQEVSIRIELLKRLKKMIQKIVTGAEAKRCPGGASKCAESKKVKGPYLVSLATVQKLANIIKLTPYDGHRGKRVQKLKQHRSDFLEFRDERRKLVRNLFDKTESSRAAYLNRLSIRPGSKAIAAKAVVTLGKQKKAAENAKNTRKQRMVPREEVIDRIITQLPTTEAKSANY